MDRYYPYELSFTVNNAEVLQRSTGLTRNALYILRQISLVELLLVMSFKKYRMFCGNILFFPG